MTRNLQTHKNCYVTYKYVFDMSTAHTDQLLYLFIQAIYPGTYHKKSCL